MKIAAFRIPSVCLVFLFLIGSVAGCSDGGDQSWLLGRWVPVHNPLNESDDTLVFKTEGKVTVETTDNRTIDGEYKIRDNFVVLELAVPKRATEVRFMISDDHKRLMYKNGAYFERKG
ncbi:MAG: hypothetical protein GC138_08030 [Gammaproteobacteria bacterium]|nr:hypothetical protein [Gammaproteobacteria bacterium]